MRTTVAVIVVVMCAVSGNAGADSPPRSGPDCVGTISRALDRAMADGLKQMKDLPPDQRKMAIEMAKNMMPKVKAAMTQVCVDDHWSPAALTCFDTAGDDAALKACQDKLTPSQVAHMQKAMQTAMGMDPPAEAATPVPAGAPPPCVDYFAIIDRLQSCAKMPPDARAAMKQAATQMASAWGNTSTWTPAMRKSIGDACKTASDAVRQAGAQLCGW